MDCCLMGNLTSPNNDHVDEGYLNQERSTYFRTPVTLSTDLLEAFGAGRQMESLISYTWGRDDKDQNLSYGQSNI